MKIGAVRAAVKAAAPSAKVSPYGESGVAVRVTRFSDLDPAVAALTSLGFKASRRKSGALQVEIEGSRWKPEWVVVASGDQ